MDKIRITAKSYDDAINEAILKLGTTSDKINIEVETEGKSGILGLFSKPWTIVVSKKSSFEKKSKEDIKKIEKIKEAVTEISEEDKIEEVVTKSLEEDKVKEAELKVEFEIEDLEKKSTNFLNDILKSMNVVAKYDFSYDNEERALKIVISSDEDMGILIGKRGQTLDSIQYLLSLVLNKDTSSYIRIKLDTENYRERRKEKLDILAKSIAAKVKKTRRAVKLEPMNPYERRVIHSALQNDNFVTTKSEGDEPFRYIVIMPKNNYNKRNYKKNN